MIRLYLDPKGEKIFTRTNASSNSNQIVQNDNKDSSEEIITNLRQRIKELEQRTFIEVIYHKYFILICNSILAEK